MKNVFRVGKVLFRQRQGIQYRIGLIQFPARAFQSGDPREKEEGEQSVREIRKQFNFTPIERSQTSNVSDEGTKVVSIGDLEQLKNLSNEDKSEKVNQIANSIKDSSLQSKEFLINNIEQITTNRLDQLNLMNAALTGITEYNEEVYQKVVTFFQQRNFKSRNQSIYMASCLIHQASNKDSALRIIQDLASKLNQDSIASQTFQHQLTKYIKLFPLEKKDDDFVVQQFEAITQILLNFEKKAEFVTEQSLGLSVIRKLEQSLNYLSAQGLRNLEPTIQKLLTIETRIMRNSQEFSQLENIFKYLKITQEDISASKKVLQNLKTHKKSFVWEMDKMIERRNVDLDWVEGQLTDAKFLNTEDPMEEFELLKLLEFNSIFHSLNKKHLQDNFNRIYQSFDLEELVQAVTYLLLGEVEISQSHLNYLLEQLLRGEPLNQKNQFQLKMIRKLARLDQSKLDFFDFDEFVLKNTEDLITGIRIYTRDIARIQSKKFSFIHKYLLQECRRLEKINPDLKFEFIFMNDLLVQIAPFVKIIKELNTGRTLFVYQYQEKYDSMEVEEVNQPSQRELLQVLKKTNSLLQRENELYSLVLIDAFDLIKRQSVSFHLINEEGSPQKMETLNDLFTAKP